MVGRWLSNNAQNPLANTPLVSESAVNSYVLQCSEQTTLFRHRWRLPQSAIQAGHCIKNSFRPCQSVQNVAPQWMTCLDMRVLKIVGRRMRHLKPLHHTAGSTV